MNGIQREAQWKPDPFDTLTPDLLSASSWLNTQSLTRGSSLRCPPSVPAPSSYGTLPSSFSLESAPLSVLSHSSSSSSASSLSAPSPLAPSLLPPPPVPSRSRSQEALRVSPNPFLTDPVPARPNSTNPFTGPLAQQSQRRSLTPDFQAQSLQRTMSAFAQPLIPSPAQAPALLPTLTPTPVPAPVPPRPLNRTMSLFTQPSTLPFTSAPLIPAPALPAVAPSTLPAPQPPPSAGKRQQWVTFDEESHFASSTKAPLAAAPIFPSSSSLPQTQTLFSCSGFDSDPGWGSSALPSLPPPIPARTAPSNPLVPARASDGLLFPKEFTER